MGSSSRNVSNQRFLSENRGDDQVDLRTQLWHKCAGLTVKVPRSGDKVFYFPQGHLEQVEAYMKQESNTDIPSYGLPSRILCKVVDVDLKAEADTDEVFAQITLLPECEEPKGPTFSSAPQKVPASSFRKSLTSSDIKTHWGCSLRKRDVAATFPPLDMSRDTASQKLIAKDLQGEIWHFHHICYGTPKQDLLFSGWAKFVSAKKLAAGDTLIFLSGQNELYVGVQRAVRLQKPSTYLCSIGMQHGILATVRDAMDKRIPFTVYYHPWTSPEQFIVAYNEFMESLQVNFSSNMRFKMLFDQGEDPEHNSRRLSGTITGKEDIDPARWPRSEWRCLKVRWDALTYAHVVPKRVSPWIILSLGSATQHQQSLVSLAQKRSMPSQPMTANFPFPKTIVDNNRLRALRDQGIGNGTGLTHSNVNLPSSSCQHQTNLAQVNSVGKRFKLFGVYISESNTGVHSQPGTSQPNFSNSYVEVLKHGTALRRSIDLSRFIAYDGLIIQLDSMFEFEGRLLNKTGGWLVTYADGDGNKMPLGDRPWFEFRAVVRKLFICRKEEVARVDRSG